jgi:hypothetical protein
VDQGRDRRRNHLSEPKAAAASGLRSAKRGTSAGATREDAALKRPEGERATLRPWWIWAGPFAILLGLLLARNGFLFTRKLYEAGDSGANSILIQRAMHFTLLVGNYSREHFNHPGPAYLYVQAFGQWLFYYGLHVVPTAWNAQLLAVFVLDSAVAGLAVLVVYGWTRSLRGAAACLAIVAVFAAVHPDALNSGWMPYLYVPMFAVFCVAAASVAAGHAEDGWILALTGWFLIHGHACFLFIVPAVLVAVAVALLALHRHAPRAALRRLGHRRGVWVPAGVISAVFALPIVVNLVLHWPGEFVKYVTYGRSSQAGGHTAAQITRYTLWFWWPHGNAWLAPVLLTVAALAVTFGLARGPLRRFLAMTILIDLVGSVAVGIYTAVGIDSLDGYYIAFFYWAAPFLLLLVSAVGIGQALGRWPGTALACAGAVAGLVAFAVAPATRTSIHDNDPQLPAVVAALAARSGGREIVLSLNAHPAWADATGLLVQAERSGVRACVQQSSWEFILTSQFICTPRQIASGARFGLDAPGSPGPVLARLRVSEVVAESAR